MTRSAGPSRKIQMKVIGRPLNLWVAALMMIVTGLAPVYGAEDSAGDEDEAEAETSAHEEEKESPSKGEGEDHGHSGGHESDHQKEGDHGGHGGHKSRIPEGAGRGYDPDKIPDRPERLMLFGEPLLGTGEISDGIEMPGGAVWRPRLHVFGTYRSAIQAFNDGHTTFAEWANRLDLFSNLQLTERERVLAGFEVLHDRDNGEFTGYNFHPGEDPLGRGDRGFVEEFNLDVRTLFFEGEIGQLVPDLRGYDPEDFDELDIGFSVGRQPLFKQDGLLINDTVDSVGVTFNSLRIPGGSNLQVTGLYGWNEVHRGNNHEQDQQHLFSLSGRADLPERTLEGDLFYVLDNDTHHDGIFWGVASIQRMGHFNTAFRVLGSHAPDGESSTVRNGYLLFGETSWTPAYSYDNAYITGFWGIDEFTSAARGPLTGGPLGQVGINFAAIGLGRYGAPITNDPGEAVGGAVGYRWILGDHKRTHLTTELGARTSTASEGADTAALSGRYQQALGQHTIVQFDLFGSVQDSDDPGFGGRIEFRYTF